MSVRSVCLTVSPVSSVCLTVSSVLCVTHTHTHTHTCLSVHTLAYPYTQHMSIPTHTRCHRSATVESRKLSESSHTLKCSYPDPEHSQTHTHTLSYPDPEHSHTRTHTLSLPLIQSVHTHTHSLSPTLILEHSHTLISS